MSDFFARLGDPVTIFTFGRSGTHLVIDLIRRQFPAFAAWKFPGEPCSATYTWLDPLVATGASPWTRHRLARPARPLLLTHRWFDLQPQFTPAIAAWLARGQLIHVVRDPRAAIASAWPIYNARDGRTAPVTPQVFVAANARRWASDARHMAPTPGLTLTYEDLIADPAGNLARIAAWIGASPTWQTPIIAPPHRSRAASRFARLVAINPASSAAVELKRHRDRHRLDWTPEFEAILAAEAAPELAAFNYARQPRPSFPSPTWGEGGARRVLHAVGG